MSTIDAVPAGRSLAAALEEVRGGDAGQNLDQRIRQLARHRGSPVQFVTRVTFENGSCVSFYRSAGQGTWQTVPE
jgi:hypothetical protein